MDPVSIAGLVLTIGDVVSSLYEYSNSVKDSKDDIRKLTQEVFALKGALEHMSATTRTYLSNERHGNDEKGIQNEGMLNMAKETLGTLSKKLAEPKNKFQKTTQALKWPFTKKEIERYIVIIERCKTWFIMVGMNETVERTSEIYDGMKQLAATIHEEIIERRATIMNKEADDILKWLAPARSDEQHLQTLQSRVPGTGAWFFDDPFGDWLTEPTAVRPILWVTGKC